MTQSNPRAIDAMIVGAQKAGTSSLAYYLGQHPGICTHRRQELSYFVDDRDFRLGYASNFRRYFSHCSPDLLLLGKSVTVMTRREFVERLHSHNTDMKLIVVLRNPVERAYSAYWWARRKGFEELPTFKLAIEANPARHGGNRVKIHSTSYLPFGEYASQVRTLHDVFGPDRVRILLFEDLHADALGVCRELFAFMGLPAFVPEVRTRRNEASLARSEHVARLLTAQHPLKRAVRRLLPGSVADRLRIRAERWNRVAASLPPMEPAVRARLTAHFAPHNHELAELIGRDLSAWDVPPESR